MRILFTCIKASSHLRVLVPVAHAAQARGHTVAVAVEPAMREEVSTGYGLEFLPAGRYWSGDPATAETVARQLVFNAHEAYTTTLVERIFLGDAALDMARDVVALAEEWQPDLVVRLAEEFGGYLAAEHLGLPHAAVASGVRPLLTPRTVAPRLRRLREGFGLAPATDPHPYLLASFAPPSYVDTELAPTLRHYRQPAAHRIGERLPGWLADLPADKPLVYAAFGSVVPDIPFKMQPLLRTVVDALGGLDCTAIVSGAVSGAEAGLSGALPGNVRLVAHIAQPLLLPVCDLFVTHAGFGSVREALRGGTPMVALPVIGDEPYHAGRCGALGVARVLPAERATAATVRDACAEVMGDPRYRHAARRVQREILTLPSVDELVGDLETLVAKGI